MKKLSKVINNKEVLEKIFNANKKLLQQCLDEHLECVLELIVEDLETLGGIRYSIDMCGGSEIEITDCKNFIYRLYDKAILIADGVYGVVEATYNEEEKNLIKRLVQGLENLSFMDYNNKNYDQLENWLEEKSELLKNKLVKKINKHIDEAWKDEYIYDYFINTFCDYIDTEKLFYDEDNYTLYENVVKSYS